MTGTTLTHYRITAKLGAGGMGEVYRATDAKLGREVAIKVLPASISQHPESLARFERVMSENSPGSGKGQGRSLSAVILA